MNFITWNTKNEYERKNELKKKEWIWKKEWIKKRKNEYERKNERMNIVMKCNTNYQWRVIVFNGSNFNCYLFIEIFNDY